jgi:multimeric flavodoxin WrbA
MKVIVLNGSPKLSKSVTMQSIKFIEMKFPAHEFQTIDIVGQVNKYEKDEETLIALCKKIEECDLVLWAFPVYHLLIPSQYKRFIELICERNLYSSFKGKYTAVFSTSIHFYDVTAHEYMRAICDDFDMKYTESLSHDMNDLLSDKGRAELELFFENIIKSWQQKLVRGKQYRKVIVNDFKYNSTKHRNDILTEKRIAIVTDASEDDLNLNEMIESYRECFKKKVEVINLREINIMGHCLGCCKCAGENICVYDEKDEYRSTLDHIINDIDIIIYAGTIKDRYLSSRFKLYYDRSFCYNHVPIFKNKQIGYMISGSLSQNLQLRQILDVYAQSDANAIGIVTDESADNDRISDEIYTLAKVGVEYSENDYLRSPNFWGVSGKKIFRDAIASELGAIFLGDYKYYKSNGIFDYPKLKDKIKYAFRRYFFKNRKVRAYLNKNMIDLMLASHVKLIEDLKAGER